MPKKSKKRRGRKRRKQEAPAPDMQWRPDICTLHPYGDAVATAMVMRKPHADERIQHDLDIPVMTTQMRASTARASALSRGETPEPPSPTIAVPPGEYAMLVEHLATCTIQIKGVAGLPEGGLVDLARMLWLGADPVSVAEQWAIWQTHIVCHDRGVDLEQLQMVLEAQAGG